MTKNISDERLTKNEVVFRKENEKAKRLVTNLTSEKDVIHFNCECSDENCTDKIVLTGKDFRELHENRQCFMVRPGHRIANIEDVIDEQDEYFVVKKKLITSS